jgi:hypothetical protein
MPRRECGYLGSGSADSKDIGPVVSSACWRRLCRGLGRCVSRRGAALPLLGIDCGDAWMAGQQTKRARREAASLSLETLANQEFGRLSSGVLLSTAFSKLQQRQAGASAPWLCHSVTLTRPLPFASSSARATLGSVTRMPSRPSRDYCCALISCSCSSVNLLSTVRCAASGSMRVSVMPTGLTNSRSTRSTHQKRRRYRCIVCIVCIVRTTEIVWAEKAVVLSEQHPSAGNGDDSRRCR